MTGASLGPLTRLRGATERGQAELHGMWKEEKEEEDSYA
jgi:hypothetical protein